MGLELERGKVVIVIPSEDVGVRVSSSVWAFPVIASVFLSREGRSNSRVSPSWKDRVSFREDEGH